MVPVTSAPERYLTIGQVAAMTHLSRSTLLRMAKSEQGPPVCRISSKLLRWPESGLYQWLRNSQRAA
jgi:predicted DNA-binding transcriptional regulator AlpA